MRGMMRKESKNVMAALLLAATILAAPAHARTGRPSRGFHDDSASRSWVVRVLGWLRLHPGLSSIWEASSSYIDPDGLS